MSASSLDKEMVEKLKGLAQQNGIDISGAKACRSSSRFCLGVEHGDNLCYHPCGDGFDNIYKAIGEAESYAGAREI